MAKDLFKKYKPTTKEERILVRREFQKLKTTKVFKKWVVWMHEKQHTECFYCDEILDLTNRKSYHIDHRVPVYYGGTNDLGNLCLACPECNRTKFTQQLERNKECLRKQNRSRLAQGYEYKLYT